MSWFDAMRTAIPPALAALACMAALAAAIVWQERRDYTPDDRGENES